MRGDSGKVSRTHRLTDCGGGLTVCHQTTVDLMREIKANLMFVGYIHGQTSAEWRKHRGIPKATPRIDTSTSYTVQLLRVFKLQAGHVFLNQLALCPVQVGMLRSHSFAVALNWLLTLPCAFPQAVSQR